MLSYTFSLFRQILKTAVAVMEAAVKEVAVMEVTVMEATVK